ncbi:MFS transporter [Solitalea canadensis]|uniref:Arabinose efflux permease family protein n=1 Tax=Solitalea canadensis (strain ATCC 29591 / DSM 3403 / JCM 21819 / LMG 8368 / NBRC 15130 / NCIMB 12057 / USAM 9D) TaxID=929556 RepID=H8KXQ7_SOLCM|nr:MFS transporter [Solitalea canadensis]AFD05472.1 arabinose efflux permease family protein [Solitalea canadensis DSM 3403]
MSQHLNKWHVMLMAMATGLIVANIYYSQPLIILISKEFNVSESNAGQINFYTQMGYALGLFFCTPLGDKIERKKQIVLMTITSVIALLGAALTQHIVVLKIAGFLIGFTSMVPQLIMPMAANLAEPERRGKIIGTIMSGLLIGILLSRTLSGFVGQIWGWREMFYIAAGICLVLAVIMYFTFPESKPTFEGSYGQLMQSLLHLVKEQRILREATAINALAFASFGMFWTTMVLLLSAEPFHFGSQTIGLFGLAAGLGALMAPLVGKIADKSNPRVTIGIGIMSLLLSFVLLYVFRSSVIGIVIGIIILDMGMQSIHVSNQTRIYALIPEARNRLNTIFMTGSFIGTALGSGIGLWVWDIKQWTSVCFVGVVVAVIAIVIYVSTYPNKKNIATVLK